MAQFFPPDDLKAAWRVSTSRDPVGRSLPRFRWAVMGETVWLFPRVLADMESSPQTGLIAQWPVRVERPQGFGFWLATAIRQDVWRALRTVRGLRPVIRVAPLGAAIDVTAGGLLLPDTPAGGTVQKLERVFTQDRIRRWTRWAAAKAAERRSQEA